MREGFYSDWVLSVISYGLEIYIMEIFFVLMIYCLIWDVIFIYFYVFEWDIKFN